MDEDTLADLKQFIAATVAQQTSNLATKEEVDRLATKEDVSRLEKKLDRIQAAVDQSVIGYISTVDEQVQDHEQRLDRLERKAA